MCLPRTRRPPSPSACRERRFSPEAWTRFCRWTQSLRPCSNGCRDPMSEPDPTFERLLEFVRDERGFDYTGYRRPTLMRRFEKRMQDVGARDWEAYRAYLVEHPEEYVEL